MLNGRKYLLVGRQRSRYASRSRPAGAEPRVLTHNGAPPRPPRPRSRDPSRGATPPRSRHAHARGQVVVRQRRPSHCSSGSFGSTARRARGPGGARHDPSPLRQDCPHRCPPGGVRRPIPRRFHEKCARKPPWRGRLWRLDKPLPPLRLLREGRRPHQDAVVRRRGVGGRRQSRRQDRDGVRRRALDPDHRLGPANRCDCGRRAGAGPLALPPPPSCPIQLSWCTIRRRLQLS